LPLFAPAAVAVTREPADYGRLKALEKRLATVDVNRLTPLEALNLLNDLGQLVREGERA
jgi:hypothetical protein